MTSESSNHDNNTKNDAEIIAAIVSSKVWSLDQQVEELTRRFKVIQSDIKYENITFKPNPDDVVLAVPLKEWCYMVAPPLPPNSCARQRA